MSVYRVLRAIIYFQSIPGFCVVSMVHVTTATKFIHNNMLYGDKARVTTTSTMNIENDIVDVNRRYKSTMTANRVLVQVDHVSGVATVGVLFGFWAVATCIIYQMEQYDWSIWSYFYLVTMPMLLVSCYDTKYA